LVTMTRLLPAGLCTLHSFDAIVNPPYQIDRTFNLQPSGMGKKKTKDINWDYRIKIIANSLNLSTLEIFFYFKLNFKITIYAEIFNPFNF